MNRRFKKKDITLERKTSQILRVVISMWEQRRLGCTRVDPWANSMHKKKAILHQKVAVCTSKITGHTLGQTRITVCTGKWHISKETCVFCAFLSLLVKISHREKRLLCISWPSSWDQTQREKVECFNCGKEFSNESKKVKRRVPLPWPFLDLKEPFT